MAASSRPCAEAACQRRCTLISKGQGTMMSVECRENCSAQYLGACYLRWLQGSVAAMRRWLLAMHSAAAGHLTAGKAAVRDAQVCSLSI